MKNTLTRFLSTIASFFLLAGFAPSSQPKKAAQTYDGKFYDTTEKMDFTDSTDAEINTYYGDIGTKTGDELLSYLYSKIACSTSELSKYYLEYGSGLNGVGRWYQITDRNWSISDSISPDTFKFVTSSKSSGASTFYLYNMYISDAANNDTTKAYSNVVNGYTKDTSLSAIDYTNYKKPNSNIQVDKEHVWAKNHGFKVKTSSGDSFVPGAPTDLHHLVAADHNTNSAGHNDHFYGTVATHNSTTEIKNYLGDGTSEVSGWLDESTDTFEPTDEWKGDIARCILYMGTRYSVKNDVNTQAEPYLYLTDDKTYTDDDADRTDKIFHGVAYNLSTLLDWNESDPVSTYEIHRNNLIYKNVQNNRNPYIDHPEWARRVYDPDYVLDDGGETSSSTSSSGTSSSSSDPTPGSSSQPDTSSETSSSETSSSSSDPTPGSSSQPDTSSGASSSETSSSSSDPIPTSSTDHNTSDTGISSQPEDDIDDEPKISNDLNPVIIAGGVAVGVVVIAVIALLATKKLKPKQVKKAAKTINKMVKGSSSTSSRKKSTLTKSSSKKTSSKK